MLDTLDIGYWMLHKIHGPNIRIRAVLENENQNQERMSAGNVFYVELVNIFPITVAFTRLQTVAV